MTVDVVRALSEVLPAESLVTDRDVLDAHREPNSLVDLLDAEALSGQDSGDVDFLSVDADTATGGDEDVAVVEGIIEVRQADKGRPEGV